MKFRKQAATLLFCIATTSVACAGTPRFSPATQNFGSVPIGSSATISVNVDLDSGGDTLRNLGIDAAPTLSDATAFGDFVLDHGNCVRSWAGAGSPLSPGVGCTFTLTYTPSAWGAAAAVVTATDYWDGHWGMMNLTAVGAPAPVSPASIPTLSQWGLTSLSLAVGALGYRRMRRNR